MPYKFMAHPPTASGHLTTHSGSTRLRTRQETMFMELRTERRPRVLIVTPQPFYEDRGTPIAVRYVARALSEIGIDVDLLAFPIGQEVHIKNVKVRRCANPFHFRRV